MSIQYECQEYPFGVATTLTTRDLIRSDLFRYLGDDDTSLRAYHAVWLYSPGFRFTFWFRIAQGLREGGKDKRRGWRRLAFWFAHRMVHHYGYKFGFDIPISVEIGPGFKLGHYGGVVINAAVKIGENCTVSHGVTIGNIPRGKKKGVVSVGDRVWFGTGSVIAGRLHVGNDALIGPNAVVIHSVPDNAIMVGPEARMVSCDPDKGSRGYALRRWEKAC